jgi:RNA polymerase sigma-70 factor, ECF subfamily
MEPAIDEHASRTAPARRSFEAFFRSESGRLGKAMYLLTGSRAEAEDLVQEAMARALVRWDRVGAMESPAAYVYRVALNLSRRRRRRRPDTDAGSGAPASDPAVVAESRAEVLAALQAVSPEQREALVLVEWLGLSPQEAGTVLGIEAASVRSRIHRARAVLRDHLGGIDDG